ncbi:BPTI/Kunitz domain-containing protein [Cololabis saira]|uniref:BPTI/Kunitz domain-containing protein n=1 Tax=Cololabis saira TaxID=129043 RepID=UPI002AD34F83|nr:BPTI/Kunitz domain-containing protein [Cololabis saira]
MKNLLLLGIALSLFHISHSNTPAFCQEKPDMGTGTLFIFSVYYDAGRDRCNPFFYTGEGGNANRFITERECLRNCSPNWENLYPTDTTRACHFKKTVGECSGSFLRYYYDSIHDKCKKFLWTGCIGNGNRFFDFESCNATCAGIHDDGEEDEEDDSDTPIAIICGVLLAVIIASIIITVTVLTVKSKKKKEVKGKRNEPPTDSPLQESAIEMT